MPERSQRINNYNLWHEGTANLYPCSGVRQTDDLVGQFGKEIQSRQISGWSQYYLDYKALKKIISAAHKSIPDSASPFLEPIHPSNVFVPPGAEPSPSALPSDATAPVDVSEPLAIPVVVREEDRGPEFQRCKAMFFFKLERELEKVRPLVVATRAIIADWVL